MFMLSTDNDICSKYTAKNRYVCCNYEMQNSAASHHWDAEREDIRTSSRIGERVCNALHRWQRHRWACSRVAHIILTYCIVYMYRYRRCTYTCISRAIGFFVSSLLFLHKHHQIAQASEFSFCSLEYVFLHRKILCCVWQARSEQQQKKKKQQKTCEWVRKYACIFIWYVVALLLLLTEIGTNRARIPIHRRCTNNCNFFG